jgi:hypothetical protein
MLVFTQDRKAEMERKYGQLPPRRRPPVYALWMDDGCKAYRDEIEALMDCVPASKRTDLIRRLEKPDLAMETYNTLAVGTVLRKHDYALEYERELGGDGHGSRTPDWYAPATAARVASIFEVFSLRLAERLQKIQRQAVDLHSRLEEIPIGVRISVRTSAERAELSPAKSKRIVQAVQRRLAIEGIDREMLFVEGVEIELSPCATPVDHALVSGSWMGMAVGEEPLREALLKKVDRYKKVAARHDAALVVVVVPQFEAGHGLDDLHRVLFGRTNGFRRDGKPTRDNSGILREAPALSAIVWVEEPLGRRSVDVCHNPYAERPLPRGFLGADAEHTHDHE